MNQKKIGGTKKKVTDALAMLLMIIVFCAFIVPVCHGYHQLLKTETDIIKSRSPGCLRSKVFRLTTL